MLLNTARSLAQWLLLTVIFCLIVGLLHMFSREVTLDSVRNIDFKLIQDFSTHYDFEQTEDRKRFKLAIGNLSAAEGKAFYPSLRWARDSVLKMARSITSARHIPTLGPLKRPLTQVK